MAAVGRRAVLEGRRRMGSFGDRLKKEREQRGISLDDISLTTKIGTRLLRALEEEKFDQLPGGIFNKGFVRAYARYVGLDEDQAVADYMIAIGANLQRPEQAVAIAPPPVPPPPVAAPAPKPRIDVLQEIRRWVPPEQIPWGLLAISLLVIALAFATWSYFHRPQVDKKKIVPASSAETLPAPVTASKIAEPASEKTQVVPPADTPAAVTAPIPTTEKTLSQAEPIAPAALHTTAEAQSADSAAGVFRLLLKGNSDSVKCWVSIAVDGKPPAEVTLLAPYRKLIHAKKEVVVKAGNVGAIDIFFNGKKLPPQGEYGEVKILTFQPDGLQTPNPKPLEPAQ
jgi:cytoskeleton protein RodZ